MKKSQSHGQGENSKSTPNRYESPYSPRKQITAAQYILERVCEKKAEKEGTKLPVYFWKIPKWKQFFQIQLRKVHFYLGKYNEKSIIRALQNPKAKNIYSLYAPWLEKIIIEEEKKLLKEKKVEQNLKIDREKKQDKIKETNNKNILDLLDD